MKVILGLGNPGKEYANTRHNVGYQTLEGLADKLGFSFSKAKFHALIAEGKYRGERVVLAKPTTYMNLSGLAASDILNFYKLGPEGLLVIYDDIDLALGELRLRKSGGAGTHNGMRDILKRLGSENFARLRLGVGQNSQVPLASFVLSGFSPEEKTIMDKAIVEAVKALEHYLYQGIDSAMNHYNRRK